MDDPYPVWKVHGLQLHIPETRDKKFVFDYKFNAKLPETGRCRTELFCAVYNLFNSNVVYRSVWPQPDRWLEAGVSVSF
ncbi:MAG: hypothetical protein R2874_02500 [Desulfobacterales bacterium]